MGTLRMLLESGAGKFQCLERGLQFIRETLKRGAAGSKNTTSSSHIIYTFLTGGLSSTAHQHGPTNSLRGFM